ncbi:hypothetical protein [Pseudomonas sp. PSKL.D1]|uniref:hypothetical protein n=1 Tax=Pseudomonas sp. PSKL.D1 TaxID=3029060 RepID=UPI00238178AD|nr:hypothetical protein [Pseudomonas sp. PSKL.D1]WDY60292.1 hypothetical protein PVV54_11905 [Pseudomonas sp. PSKL.D1]
MTIESLERFKEEITGKLRDSSFTSTFLACETDFTSIAWSKGPAFNLIPFELEMSGVAPCKLTSKEPLAKKYVHKHCYHEGRLFKVDIYDAKGQVYEWEYYIYGEGRVYSLKINRHNEIGWLKAVDLQEGQVVRACRVDFDSEFWTFGYEWDNGRLQEILTLSSNSLPGVKLYPSFVSDNVIESLYFLRGDQKVLVYSA